MEITEIVLLVVGGIIFILSFLIPDKKGEVSVQSKELVKEEIADMVSREMESVRGHVDGVVEEAVTYAMEKTERSLERLSNEKIMAVSEYSDTVLAEIHKNHEEAMFLYDMLNNKHVNLKNTVSEVNRTVKEAEEKVSSFRSLTVPAAAPLTPQAASVSQPAVLSANPAQTVFPVNPAPAVFPANPAPAAPSIVPAAPPAPKTAIEMLAERNAVQLAKARKVRPGESPGQTVFPAALPANPAPAASAANPVPVVLPANPAPAASAVNPVPAVPLANPAPAASAVNPVPVVPLANPAPAALSGLSAAPGGVSFLQEKSGDGRNNKERILELYRQGKSKVAIARELGLGVGEVKLVIDLFKNR